MNMKKRFVGVVALLALTTAPALAADLPVKAVPMMPVATAYNWTGFYSATGLGGTWWNVKGEYPGLGSVRHDVSASRFNYASIFGAQYQWGNWVLGAEVAFNKLYGNQYASVTGGTGSCLAGAPGFSCNAR